MTRSFLPTYDNPLKSTNRNLLARLSELLKRNYLLILVIILAIVPRTYGLYLNPVGVTHDEIYDLINAKSIAMTGENVPGMVAGIFTRDTFCISTCVFGELISYLLVPWMLIAPLGLFWSKIPFVVASLGIVYFTYKLFVNLSGKKAVGILTALLLAINPWAIHFGRTTYENIFTFLFYIWGLYIFTKRQVSKIELGVGVIIIFLGFLSYMGAKPFLPFLITLGLGYSLLINKLKHLRFILILFILSFILFGSYLYILKNSYAGLRLQEIQSSTSLLTFTENVDKQRQVALEIPLGRDIFINKYIEFARYLLDRYLGVFSANYLFNTSEASLDAFMISKQSFMYLLDFPFIVLGVAAIGNPLVFLFLTILVAITPISSVLNTIHNTYALRAGILFPILVGLSAWGIYWTHNSLKIRFLKILFVVCLIFLYLISFVYFAVMYWYRTPFEKSSGWFFHERLLSKYILLSQEKNKKIVVLSKSPSDYMYMYAFYSGEYNSGEGVKKINTMLENRAYEFKNITVTSDCLILPNEINTNTIYVIERGLECEDIYPKALQISDPKDGGHNYKIFNDLVCPDISLNKYPYPRSISQFDVEDMSRDQFCKIWISDPNQ